MIIHILFHFLGLLKKFQELEISRNTHYQQNMKIEEQAEQNNDLQNVIMQFRAYVNQLQVIW